MKKLLLALVLVGCGGEDAGQAGDAGEETESPGYNKTEICSNFDEAICSCAGAEVINSRMYNECQEEKENPKECNNEHIRRGICYAEVDPIWFCMYKNGDGSNLYTECLVRYEVDL